MFPERAHELEHQIEHLLEQASWREEIPEEEDWLNALSNFLCDVKESQIRSGLHIFGEVPSGQQQTEFLLSLLRLGTPHSRGLVHCLGDLPKDVDLQTLSLTLRDELNERAKLWVEGACSGTAEPTDSHELQQLRTLLQEVLLPRLLDCERETEQLLRGLSGKIYSAWTFRCTHTWEVRCPTHWTEFLRRRSPYHSHSNRLEMWTRTR